VEVNLICFIVVLYMYCRWRSNYQEGEGWDLINQFSPSIVCACSKPRPRYPTSYGVVVLCSVIKDGKKLFVLVILEEFLTITV